MDKRKSENMDDRQWLEKEIRVYKANLARAKKAMERASAARLALEPGSSRARVTTANARLNTYCEAVERYGKKVEELYHQLVTMTTWE